jgi:hypothetical protein
MKRRICTEHGQEIPAGKEVLAVIVDGDDRRLLICAQAIEAVPQTCRLSDMPPNGIAVWQLGEFDTPLFWILPDWLWAYMPSTAARALD